MWTATITHIEPIGDQVEVSVTLADETRKQGRRYVTDGTLTSLRPQVLASIAKLDAQVQKSDLSVGLTLDLTEVGDAAVDLEESLN